ncbi:response regulator [Pelagovum pacificum]|uniref:Response regulator n=1 Tax=Pelagovum pacificum TaxID=2588711 RepID=A0A5C5GDF8_9RHOB|nr:response regulator [Pelagovum pacificum]QQA44098.1 response regulator [Pelagovum pacificum]TNY32773.1 response regulator [Pelagovum pacificum]
MTHGYGSSGLNLIVVEDETLVSMDLEATLEELGHRVIGVASHVERALEHIAGAGTALDAVILDLTLAGRSAQPVAERLHRQGTPYVVVTGLEESDVRRHGFSGPYVPKPYQPERLHQALLGVVADLRPGYCGSSSVELPSSSSADVVMSRYDSSSACVNR